MIHHGDCLDVMAGMEPESVDAIVTDPPYGLEFMGKEWDKLGGGIEPTTDTVWTDRAPGSTLPFGGGGQRVRYGKSAKTMQAWHEAWAEAAYRVAKPSAYLLAFGGTRTVHRMTCAIEDAGWIIRDMLVWGYASGFPKSKASLKPAWEPIVMARKPGPLRMLAIDACRIPSNDGFEEAWDKPVSTHAGNVMLGNLSGTTERKWVDLSASKPVGGRWPANIILTDPIFDGGIEGVVGGGETASGSRSGVYGGGGYSGDWPDVSADIYGDSGTYSRFFELPRGESCDWCGASSAASSSSQPSGRDGSAPSHAATEASSVFATTTASPTTSGTEQTSWHGESASTSRNTPSPGSRRAVRNLSSDPANNVARRATSFVTIPTTPSLSVCPSCADDAMRSSTDEPGFAEQPDSARMLLVPKAARSDREPVLGGLPLREQAAAWGDLGPVEGNPRKPDNGHVSRRVNAHPTVKPTDLMRHLVRLVTPTGGTVLDPFLGSGTTALAAEMEGFAWIGIEREAEYVAIAEARLNGTQQGMAL